MEENGSVARQDAIVLSNLLIYSNILIQCIILITALQNFGVSIKKLEALYFTVHVHTMEGRPVA